MWKSGDAPLATVQGTSPLTLELPVDALRTPRELSVVVKPPAPGVFVNFHASVALVREYA